MNERDFISEKRAGGATIMETIKAVMNEYGLSLGQAKELVSSHPAWTTVVDATRPLHEELDKLNESEKKNIPRA